MKSVFDECWDTFQLQMVLLGGNKHFYEFMREYQKEREPILRKYTNNCALFYRKRLCFQAKKVPFDEPAPPRNAQEAAQQAGKQITKGAVAVGAFVSETNDKYKVGEKASAMAETTKNAFVGLFNKAKEAMSAQPAPE